MSRFVRASKYRHLYGDPSRDRYENLKVSASAFDSDLVKVSTKYLSVNWQSSGGGAFAVLPLNHPGKLPDLFPLCRAHTAPVLDTDWSPFADDIVASAGEDGRIAVTKVDETVFEAAFLSEGREIRDLQPVMTGKVSRKAGRVLWSPTANNVLAASSYEVRLFDTNTMQIKAETDAQPDMVGDLSFNYVGDGLVTTCKDKKLRLYDTRQGGAAHTVADSHTGIKVSRVSYMGDLDRICTTGFSKLSDRQVFVWDARKLTAPVKQVVVDTSAGTLMPFFNAGTNVLFLAGKGDGNIRYYEYENDDLFSLSEHKSSEPQRGMTFLPPRAVNVSDCEVARAYKVTNQAIEPISFIVPRKSDSFQADIFPPAPSGQPALSADEFFSGKTAAPLLVDMEDQSKAPVAAVRRSTAPASSSSALSPTPKTPSSTTSAEAPRTGSSVPTPKPSASPVHPASSVEDAGGIVPREAVRSPAPLSRPVSPPTSATPAASGNGGQGDEESASLRKEIASLKDQLGERDHLIRKLELQVEQFRTNARKAREALSDS